MLPDDLAPFRGTAAIRSISPFPAGKARSDGPAHLLGVLHGLHFLLNGLHQVVRRGVAESHVVLAIKRNEFCLGRDCLLFRHLQPLKGFGRSRVGRPRGRGGERHFPPLTLRFRVTKQRHLRPTLAASSCCCASQAASLFFSTFFCRRKYSRMASLLKITPSGVATGSWSTRPSSNLSSHSKGRGRTGSPRPAGANLQ